MINWNLWLVTEPLTGFFQKHLAAHTHFVAWNLAWTECTSVNRSGWVRSPSFQFRSLSSSFQVTNWVWAAEYFWNMQNKGLVTSHKFQYIITRRTNYVVALLDLRKSQCSPKARKISCYIWHVKLKLLIKYITNIKNISKILSWLKCIKKCHFLLKIDLRNMIIVTKYHTIIANN